MIVLEIFTVRQSEIAETIKHATTEFLDLRARRG